MRIEAFEPYRNKVLFSGRTRTLSWCHQSISYASSYWKIMHNTSPTFEEIIYKIADVEGMNALLFGALKVENDFSLMDFLSGYSDNEINGYIEAVTDGLMSYLPTGIDEEEPDELDLSYPDKRPQESLKEPVNFTAWFCELIKHGFSVRELKMMTWDDMIEAHAYFSGKWSAESDEDYIINLFKES